MKVEMIGKENEIKKSCFIIRTNGVIIHSRFWDLLLLIQAGTSLLSKLTSSAQMLLTAYGLGYYDVPRRISSDELSSTSK